MRRVSAKRLQLSSRLNSLKHNLAVGVEPADYSTAEVGDRETSVAYSRVYKKAELTPGLAHDRAVTWRLTLNLDSSAAIERLTCAATWRKR